MEPKNSLRAGKLIPRDISESLGKLPPQAIDLEEVVLGAAMLEKNVTITVLAILTPDDFYDDRHKEIFQAIVDLSTAGAPVDMRTVKEQMQKNGKLELIGGAYYIAQLTSQVASAANSEYHARIIQEKALRRALIEMASQIHRDAYEDSIDTFQLLDDASAIREKLLDKIKIGGERNIKDGIVALANDINKRKADTPEIIGVPSGYLALDKLTLGWRPGKFILVAARPSMGKTTFVINCARNAAVDFKIPVSIFSLEMTFEELVAMCVSIDTDIELRKVTSKPFEPLDMVRFVHKTVALTNAPIWIEDSHTLSISTLRTKARRHKEKYGTGLIIVDYLQLLRGDQKSGNREQEISSISRTMKLIAMELKIPVIGLSQLSRKVEERPLPKKPMLADLRESGALEQDADIVALLWRADYYKIKGDDGGTFIDGITEINIAKHRGGKTDPVFVQMLPRTSKYVNIDSPYTHEQRPEPPPQEPVKPSEQNSDDLPF